MKNLSLLGFIDELEIHFEEVEPNVRAFVPEAGRFKRLRSEGKTLLKHYPNPEIRPPLFGLFVGVKDIFHADGFATRAGSHVPPERLSGSEAVSVTKLKHAGALIFGKTVTTEFAYFAPGPTRNPKNLNHTPGGSSSGSAAAVAAELVPLALGTQTIGSITRPASFCGVVGFKPTYERISRSGVIPLSPSVDHIGFFTNDLKTALKTAKILCNDWKSPRINTRKPVLGIPEGPYLQKAGEEMMAHFTQTCRQLNDAGFTLKSVSAMNDFEEIYDRHNNIVAVEAAQIHKEWYPEFGMSYHPRTIELIERGQQVDPKTYRFALQGREKLREGLTTLMNDHGLDLWLSPSAIGSAPRGFESTGDPVMNLPWTHCGFPTLNIPTSMNTNSLPLGLQFAAQWGSDEDLLSWGNEIERLLS